MISDKLFQFQLLFLQWSAALANEYLMTTGGFCSEVIQRVPHCFTLFPCRCWCYTGLRTLIGLFSFAFILRFMEIPCHLVLLQILSVGFLFTHLVPILFGYLEKWTNYIIDTNIFSESSFYLVLYIFKSVTDIYLFLIQFMGVTLVS